MTIKKDLHHFHAYPVPRGVRTHLSLYFSMNLPLWVWRGKVYLSEGCDGEWSGQRGSNPRLQAWEACTLPTELCPHPSFLYQKTTDMSICFSIDDPAASNHLIFIIEDSCLSRRHSFHWSVEVYPPAIFRYLPCIACFTWMG